MEQQRAHDRERTWAEWMRAANAGDEIAYRRLLEALAPLLRQVVLRGFTRTGFGNCDVEDVVQETLLAIHLKRQTWDEHEAITPWVTAIARHKLIDSLRRRGRHREYRHGAEGNCAFENCSGASVRSDGDCRGRRLRQ